MGSRTVTITLTRKNFEIVKASCKQGYYIKYGDVINSALLEFFSRRGFFEMYKEAGDSRGTEENET
jgi:hypothetical protein